MDVKVRNISGQETESVSLHPDVFEIEPNNHAVYQSVRTYLAHQRQGTAKTKGRSEVRGGGKKPWRQKGRGTARAGSSRSPLWVGGGTLFGPKPHTYKLKLPAKMQLLAKCSAYSMKAKDGQIHVIEDFNMNEPKTKEVFAILQKLNLENVKTLLLVPEYNQSIWLACRNIPTLKVKEAANASTYDLLDNQALLIQKSSLSVIEHVCTGN